MGSDPVCVQPADYFDHDEHECREPKQSWADDPPLVCEMPGTDPEQSMLLLDALGEHAVGGMATGAKLKMNSLGEQIPLVRERYEAQFKQLEQRVKMMTQQGKPIEEIAEYVRRERASLARAMRGVQGPGATVFLEVRDNVKYGVGGRTHDNMYRYHRDKLVKAGQDASPPKVYERMKTRGLTPNDSITRAAKGAKYLRHGGRAVVVVSISITAYRLATAPDGELGKVISDEFGAAVGGAGGAALGVGLCIVLGIGSGGLGLLACGIVGGAIGGFAGEAAAGWGYEKGEAVLFATPEGDPEVGVKLSQRLSKDGRIDGKELGQCVAPVAPLTE